MSRRQFLKSAQLTAIGALVASAYPPTAWGKVSDDCRFVRPGDVGLTPAEMATVTQASGIDFGTELFQDTIYSEPAIAPNQPNTQIRDMLACQGVKQGGGYPLTDSRAHKRRSRPYGRKRRNSRWGR